MTSLAGQVAIVTGGASGLGLGIVQRFVEAGATVVIADINDRDGEAYADRIGAHYQHVDVTNAEHVNAVIRKSIDDFGRLDVMVNNAGISSRMHRSFLHDDLSD